MPLKSGRLTKAELKVAEVYAVTGDQGYAAHKAGITQAGAAQALARPAVQAEVIRRQQDILTLEILPLASVAHKRLLTDAKVPAGAVLGAVKLAYDRTLPSEADDAADKGEHEMTWGELTEEIRKADLRRAAMERELADRARPVIEAEPTANHSQEGGVFA